MHKTKFEYQIQKRKKSKENIKYRNHKTLKIPNSDRRENRRISKIEIQNADKAK